MSLDGILHPNLELKDPRLIAIYKKFNEKKTNEQLFNKYLQELNRYLEELHIIYVEAITLQKKKEALYLIETIAKEEESLKTYFKKVNENIIQLNKIVNEQIAIDNKTMAELREMYKHASEETREQLKFIEENYKYINDLIVKNQLNINRLSADISKVENSFALIKNEQHIEPLVNARANLAVKRDYFRDQQWLMKGVADIKKQQLELLEKLAKLEDELGKCTDPDKIALYNQQISQIKKKIESLNKEARKGPKKATLRQKERELLKKKEKMSHKKFGMVMMALENKDPKIKEAALKLKEEDNKPVVLSKEEQEFDKKIDKIKSLGLHNANLQEKLLIELSELEEKIEPEVLHKIESLANKKYKLFSSSIANLKFNVPNMSAEEFEKRSVALREKITSEYKVLSKEIEKLKTEHKIETKSDNEKNIESTIESKQPDLDEKSVNNLIQTTRNKAETSFKDLNKRIDNVADKHNEKELLEVKGSLQEEHKNINKKLDILENSENLLTPKQKSIVLEEEINKDINDMKNNLDANLKKEELKLKIEQEEEPKSSIGKKIDNDNEIKEAMITQSLRKHNIMNENTSDSARYIEANPRNRVSPTKMETHAYKETKSGNIALDQNVTNTKEAVIKKFDNLTTKGQKFCSEKQIVLANIKKLEDNYKNMPARKVERMCNIINDRIDNLEKMAKENFPKWEVERQAVLRETEKLYKLRQKVKNVLNKDLDPDKPSPGKPKPRA